MNLATSKSQKRKSCEIQSLHSSKRFQTNVNMRSRGWGPSSDEEKENSCVGKHETQVSEGGEADLHKHVAECLKNPGHTDFKPVQMFNIQDLPEGYRDIDLYKLIKALADLTVRVEVKMTSPERPEFWPKTSMPYPFYGMLSSTNLRFGSGRVRYVSKFTNGYDVSKFTNGFDHRGNIRGTSCPCHKCHQSGEPNNIWWEIVVQTAAHVVFDNVEANHTSCRLFYDSQKSPVVILDKVSVECVDVERDWCKLRYVTCDHDLGNKLYTMKRNFGVLWKKVSETFEGHRDEDRLTFIVSHPTVVPNKSVLVSGWTVTR